MTPHLVRTAFNNLRSTTLRTILAMLGILVGTASVVAMVSTGQMATEEALKEFKGLGTDLISVSLYSKGQGSDTGAKKFDLNEALAMKESSKDISLIAPYTTTYSEISYRGNILNGGIIGATDAFDDVLRIRMLSGRFISPFEHYEKFCVLGYQMYQNVKAYTNDPINSRIKLGTTLFTIIGVLDNFPENSFVSQDVNNSIIIPIRTTNFLSSNVDISNIIMRLHPDADIDKVKSSLEGYLASQSLNKEIFFRSAKELIRSMEAQHRIFTLLLSLIGSISLFVGGIGVMNIMLVSVIERRREIGIRLALGARRKEIQSMFLTEAILLSVIGGGLGIITGILSSLVIAAFLHWSFTVFFLPPFVGFTVSVVIGVFFGYYPAHKAAQLDPIQTLRSE